MMGAGAGLMISAEVQAALDPVYVEECGSCHVAYPPRALGASSWRLVLSDLSHHFGADASLEESARSAVGRYLEENARRKETPGGDGRPAQRISESLWFTREHDEISGATWQAAKLKANCAACHLGAEQGNYSEHHVRLPK
jgi:hypothetical protein